ncbi:hypothetical protein CGZ96_08220 [Enemella evansiae]|nr:hypothetical protein CGZ96_08220 [Enemella evansiae]
MQHQQRLAAQRQRAIERERLAAARHAEQTQRAAERAQAAYNRAVESERKRLEAEARAAHVAAMEAKVEAMNAELADQYAELDGILSATLDVDDFVDLEALRVVATHPPFDREELRTPIPRPLPLLDYPPPRSGEVPKPTGVIGRKKKLAEAQAAAEAKYADDYARWQHYMATLPARRAEQQQRYAAAERNREEHLARELDRYRQECQARERQVQEQNAGLDELIVGLGYGTVDAVQEYVGIVLANSIYPESFPVVHSAEFDPATAELRLHVKIPGPDQIPTVKTYRYTKASDEITSTTLAQKDLKDRYAAIVHNVAIRSLHEVFEADRRGIIRSISLELGTETVSPATGRPEYVPLVAVATGRETFSELNLSAVVPSATLQHLGAALSKNPYGLTPVSSAGVRRAR